jgi:anti-sigma factor RsiW
MNCDELSALLPLIALDELEPARGDEANAHLATCEHCRDRLATVERTRALLDAAAVPEFAPLAGADVRAAARDATTVRPFELGSWRRAAAAALLLVSAGGSGFLGGRLATPAAPPTHGPIVRREPTAEPAESAMTNASVVRVLLTLDERIAALEQRHERDLLELAQAVDRQQTRRDRGLAQQIESLEQQTRVELVSTRSALDEVAAVALAPRSKRTDVNHDVDDH